MQTITSSTLLRCRLPGLPAAKLLRCRCRCRTVISASSKKRDERHDRGGGLVDKNMIVLRKRIHETKMAERNYEPPSEWMEWEKQYYTTYDSDICKVVGVLQTLLMNTRPRAVLGLLGLLLFSMPTSLIFVSSHLMQAMAYYLIPGLHI